jgi:hypothetical protein
MLVFYISVESTLWSNFFMESQRKQQSMQEKELVSNRTDKYTWLENKRKVYKKTETQVI